MKGYAYAFILSALVCSPAHAKILASPSRSLKDCTSVSSIQRAERWVEYTRKLIDQRKLPLELLHEATVPGSNSVTTILSWLKKKSATNLEYSVYFKTLNLLSEVGSNDFISTAQIHLKKNLEDYDELAALRLDTTQKTATLFNPVSPLPMASIPAGSFKLSGRAQSINKFQISNQLITLDFWQKIMGSDSKPPTHPNPNVSDPFLEPVQITWASAADFANRVSILSGYEPIYDFQHTKFKPGTSAEAGDLEVLANSTILIRRYPENLKIPLGFRLPTYFEMFYIASNLGTFESENEKLGLTDLALLKIRGVITFFAGKRNFRNLAKLMEDPRPRQNIYAKYRVADQDIEDFRRPDLESWADLFGAAETLIDLQTQKVIPAPHTSFFEHPVYTAKFKLTFPSDHSVPAFNAPELFNYKEYSEENVLHVPQKARDGKEAPFCLCTYCCEKYGHRGFSHSKRINSNDAGFRLVLGTL